MLSRRDFLGGAAAALAAAPASRPNVLFISVDDMNDWVGCLGHPTIKTPNINKLARRGALFADAHCASPLCNPSRTALLTGLRSSSSGIYDNEQYWRPFHPKLDTLPMYFRKHGYHVAGAGKVFHHVAGFNPPDQWDEFQLQEFDDPWYRRDEWYPWNKKVPNPPGHPFNGLQKFQGEFDWGVIPGRPEAAYGDQRAIEFGEKFLKQPRRDKPFFLAIGLWHPHIPMFAPQHYFDLYQDAKIPEAPADDLDDIPAAGQKFAAFRRDEHERIVREGKWKDAVQAYMACITFADAMIGQLLAALDASPYAKNTVIVLWSDNGWHLGEKKHWHKSTLWQRSTHVPLIFAGPGVADPGVTRKQPVSLLDIYPTLTALCGLPANPRNEGSSLSPLLKDPRARRQTAVCTYLPGNHAVITEEWRYISYHDGGEELYDRRADPNEYRNLADQPLYQVVKEKLARALPPKSAAPVPDRTHFDFDFATYTYRRK